MPGLPVTLPFDMTLAVLGRVDGAVDEAVEGAEVLAGTGLATVEVVEGDWPRTATKPVLKSSNLDQCRGLGMITRREQGATMKD